MELNRILLEGCKQFVNSDVTTVEALRGDPNVESFLIKMSPVIVTYLRNKVKLFIKHIVAPNFPNYDLKLDIADSKLQVEIHGFLYATEFEEVNKMLLNAGKWFLKFLLLLLRLLMLLILLILLKLSILFILL